MNIFTEFLLNVVAGIVHHILCKWLDRLEQRKCKQQKRKSGNQP